MKVTTTDCKQVWQSPDKQKTIWQVTLKDEAGKKYGLKTYSESISKIGFEGEVESYTAKNGDKFVKQPQQAGGQGNASRTKQDAQKQREIRAEWAIGKAISSLGVFPLDEDALKSVQSLATDLYVMVDKVIESSVTTEEATQ